MSQYDLWEASTKGVLYQRRDGQWRALIMDYAPRFGDNRAGLPGGHVDRADTDLE